MQGEYVDLNVLTVKVPCIYTIHFQIYLNNYFLLLYAVVTSKNTLFYFEVQSKIGAGSDVLQSRYNV